MCNNVPVGCQSGLLPPQVEEQLPLGLCRANLDQPEVIHEIDDIRTDPPPVPLSPRSSLYAASSSLLHNSLWRRYLIFLLPDKIVICPQTAEPALYHIALLRLAWERNRKF
jgi:hypothetical protein